jgi:hypothetical protein
MQFFAFFGQPVAQHILAFGIKRQVVQFGLVSRNQVAKKWGNAHVRWEMDVLKARS